MQRIETQGLLDQRFAQTLTDFDTALAIHGFPSVGTEQ